MSNRKTRLLDIAELTSLASYIVVLVTTVLVKQLILLVVPLLVALLLNIINRQRYYTDINKVNQNVESLKQQIKVLPSQNNKFIEVQFNKLNQQLKEIQHQTDINKVNQNVESLKQQIKILPSQNNEFIEIQFNKLNQQLKETQPVYEYNLVFMRSNSRDILLNTLNRSEQRVILVCPWLCDKAITQEILNQIKLLLQREIFVDIGYGKFDEIENGELKSDLPFWKYSALPALKNLQNRHSKLNLKLLGTHEKFLVCDTKFAMLGSHNFLTSSDRDRDERELGIKTNDPCIISELINYFDNAKSLQRHSPQKNKNYEIDPDDIPF